MPDETFAFRGLRRFIALGVIAGLTQVVAGLSTLGIFGRRKRVAPILSSVWLCGTGVVAIAAFLSCRNGRVSLTDQGVDVRLGWLWRQVIPYATIAAAVPMDRSFIEGFGIRTDFRGTVAVVPWGTDVVALDLSPPYDLPIFFVVKQKDARRLQLGVEEEDRFVSSVMQRVLATPPARA
ncbi:MAG: hypothetical protein AB7R89_28385 [Dehalococcoidia bacterium]